MPWWEQTLPPELREELQRNIREHANGMYHWVTMILAELKRTVDPEELTMERLGWWPRDKTELYDLAVRQSLDAGARAAFPTAITGVMSIA